ncbi:unnamed protein product [Rotaria sp. Silwood1]|nr:unnamed protein product [Rotaria sp. Silwood1]CAF1600520.1 unnamed protein product [Rotaria sp. Silwood1]CAF3707518.1 unnamed protein product [Rotaria sp. Silwood1]CAF3728153.1 unnamed protein product [Rotaria sp. Silwood1]CAF3746955.1 unnamed protein product [Rotaria sp. Silwood1]
MKCCGTSNKLHIKECEFLNGVDENEEFLNIIQECKNDEGLIDPDILIKKMENSSNEHIKHNVDAVRKKLKNLLPNDKNDQKHVLEENLLINTLKGGMQEAIDKVKSSRNSIKK